MRAIAFISRLRPHPHAPVLGPEVVLQPQLQLLRTRAQIRVEHVLRRGDGGVIHAQQPVAQGDARAPLRAHRVDPRDAHFIIERKAWLGQLDPGRRGPGRRAAGRVDQVVQHRAEDARHHDRTTSPLRGAGRRERVVRVAEIDHARPGGQWREGRLLPVLELRDDAEQPVALPTSQNRGPETQVRSRGGVDAPGVLIPASRFGPRWQRDRAPKGWRQLSVDGQQPIDLAPLARPIQRQVERRG